MSPSGSSRLALLVRQHAQTSALLGVDFVPAFRRPGAPRAIGAPPPGRPAAAVSAHADAPASFTEPKPGGPVTTAPLVPPRAPHPAAPPAASPAIGVRDRAAAQRLLDQALARYLAEAPHQHFVTAHTNIVFGSGDPCARLMFIGEAPGAEEDKVGLPFVGRAGQLLEKMILAMGLTREEVYITNVLKTRPPNNATPTLDEAARCEPYLCDQICAVRPEVIVALGLPATRVLLKTDEPMARLRGRWFEFAGGGLRIPVMPTYHPAFVLRSYTPEVRGKVWSDLRLALDRLGLAPPGRTEPPG
ncbi:MAG TPA: uracil-DNA glycosylase [Phycisphaerales bacterium]|nr:uracil-DNA glycosylase [Phycisphaerales bacterium]